MSYLSRIKNPDLPYLSIVAALRAYVLRPASLDVLASLGTTACFTRTYSPYLINCRMLLLTYLLVSYILTIPYVLSLVLTITIYAMPPSPLRPIKGVRGIYPS